jgi:AcrR family transcriptional regulator
MVKKAEIPNHIVDAAMALAARGRWRDVSLAEIAEAAEVPLSAVYEHFPSKHAIVGALIRRIDREVLAGVRKEDSTEPARDRLFDVLMMRFEALLPYREAVATLLNHATREPLSAVADLPQLNRSMAWMLEAAGLSAEGVRGWLRTEGLMAVYLATLRVWLNDDSPDLARTMAALDANLRRAERALERARTLRRSRRSRPEDGAPQGATEAEAQP